MPVLSLAFALLGVTLGSPAGDLRAKLGDPLLVERISDLSRTADYLRADDPSAVLRVTERNGVVFAVEVEREHAEPAPGNADAYGVTLGMQRSAVVAKRGKPAFETMNTILYPEDQAEDASLIYRFDGDILESIRRVGGGRPRAAALGRSRRRWICDGNLGLLAQRLCWRPLSRPLSKRARLRHEWPDLDGRSSRRTHVRDRDSDLPRQETHVLFRHHARSAIALRNAAASASAVRACCSGSTSGAMTVRFWAPR
jgi:hypothetical protein